MMRRSSSSLALTCLLASASMGCARQATQPPPVTKPAEPAQTEACERGSPAATLPALGHAELIGRLGTGLDAYRVTGGAWLPGQPLLFNEPFDFAIAMGLENVGPAIAAGKRKQANEAKRDAAATLALSPSLQKRLSALRGCGVHVYGVLWGTREASTLQVVIDAFEPGERGLQRREHTAWEAGARPLQGPDGWDAPKALDRAFASALE